MINNVKGWLNQSDSLLSALAENMENEVEDLGIFIAGLAFLVEPPRLVGSAWLSW